MTFTNNVLFMFRRYGLFNCLIYSKVRLSFSIKDEKQGGIAYWQLRLLIICQKDSKIKVMVG